MHEDSIGKPLRISAAAAGIIAVVLFVQACGQAGSSGRVADAAADGYRIVNVYPHDPEAFTQGLIYRDGFLFESTGLNGHSTLRKVRLETGEVIQQRDLDERYFGEGLTDWGDTLIQLTWQSHLAFRYGRESFDVLGTFTYAGEGWGLTQDGERLIMSDGSATLRFLNPATFQETRRLAVTDNNRPVADLNELEYVRGEIYANVWGADMIARISPQSGHVLGWIDLRALVQVSGRKNLDDVLNGIAYDARGGRLFVTGKRWPRLFEIELVRGE
jgi:glutamine cyclotransferase